MTTGSASVEGSGNVQIGQAGRDVVVLNVGTLNVKVSLPNVSSAELAALVVAAAPQASPTLCSTKGAARMSTLLLRAVLPFACFGLMACASKPSDLPVVDSVCLVLDGLEAHEVELVRKHAAENLAQYGFRLAAAGCDATVTFKRFGKFQGESVRTGLLPFTTRRDVSWRQEGTVLVQRGEGRTDLEDYSVNLVGYTTLQDLLVDFGWKVVRPVTWLYQPKTPPKS